MSGCGGDEQKSVKKGGNGGNWVNIQKMPYPQCGRSIKAYARGNNDAPSITKYGSLVQSDAQIVALRAHCAQCARHKPSRLTLPAEGEGGP